MTPVGVPGSAASFFARSSDRRVTSCADASVAASNATARPTQTMAADRNAEDRSVMVTTSRKVRGRSALGRSCDRQEYRNRPELVERIHQHALRTADGAHGSQAAF